MEKTTAVADEAVGNIRTVRAFAMEDQEQELFRTEATVAMLLNQKLGLGIALFQAGTNMFLNRYFTLLVATIGWLNIFHLKNLCTLLKIKILITL